MQNHLDLSDAEFEATFSNSTLDPKLFSHEAHLRLAWLHITKYGIDTAVHNVKNQIKNYVAALGAEDKYNETVTIAGVRAVGHFVSHSGASNFPDFINEHPQLKDNFKGLLLSHYETDIFESETAKKTFIEPELIPFD